MSPNHTQSAIDKKLRVYKDEMAPSGDRGHTLPMKNHEYNPCPDNISHEIQTDITANNDLDTHIAIKRCEIMYSTFYLQFSHL